MMNGKRVAVVLPAYNAELTLVRTVREIPMDVVDDVILRTPICVIGARYDQ